MKKLFYLVFKSLVFLILVSLFLHEVKGKNDSRIILVESPLPKNQREAILILPGLGDSRKGRNAQEKFFSDRGYDVYIPDFLDRNSFEGSVENLSGFYEMYDLAAYKKIHAFCYILGAFAMNEFLAGRTSHNIATIVYDRSPLQERAPFVVVEAIPRLGRLVVGKVVADFSTVSYLPFNDTSVSVGIVVESKATRLIRMFKKTALRPGPVSWNPADLNQGYQDIHFTRLNHAQMYHRFDVVGDEIMYFIENAQFSPRSVDTAYTWNPYKPWRKKDEKSVSPNNSLSGSQPSGVFILKWFDYQ
ncbi:MAG: hypothetical protein R3D00_17985 [Bacteroidia bacterium]